MAIIDWSVGTSEHVREAARQLDAGKVVCRSPARNTFVKLRGRSYPAKFIRGLAYEVATGRRLNPNTDFAGGKETARFLANLGFEVDYESRSASRQRPRQKSPRQPDPTTRKVTKYLTLGVNSPLRNKVTTTGNRITSPHVELVCVVDLGSEPFRLHWTGKSYPTNSQADRLVRITDLTSHFTTLSRMGGGR